jgi:hypothetical protein
VPHAVCAARKCGNVLPEGRRKFCTDACGNRERVARYHERTRDREFGGKLAAIVDKTESKDGRGSMRRGDLYQRFIDAGWPALAAENGGKLTHQQIAEQFGEAIGQDVSRVSVTHWLAARVADAKLENLRAQWQVSDDAEAAKQDFRSFRNRYFTIARGSMKGKPPATTDFHLRWINAIVETMRDGAQLMILSPPRHGKSLLMAHFVIWQIVNNPDIAIIWVAGNENIAKRFGSLVKDELERNAKLVADFCGPGGSFKPSTRTGAQWRDDEFEVATRTTPQPAPTFKAVGRGGRLLSMDADLIVTDDIEDNKTTLQPGQREQTETWFHTDLASRKEEHTGWVYIGSRQHPEDLASKLLVSEEWRTIVESAHDTGCAIPLGNEDEHVDCVLWPEVRSFKYLMQKKRTVGENIYDMQYLNRPRSEGMTLFPRHEIEQCRDRSRVLGDLPPKTRLIAGLDPSNKNFTSAVLWAVQPETNLRWVVDIENRPGSGLVNMRAILELWQQRYVGIEGWAIEKNIAEDSLNHDLPLRELIQTKGIRLIHHTTGHNKWDLRIGVPKMADHFKEQRINLPYGDEETREKVDKLIDQFVNFTDQVSSHQTRWVTDLVMASWFPEKHIQEMALRFDSGMAVDYASHGYSGVRFGGMFGER